ncbi:MAG: DUF2993 domain-containing protein [Marmoricola sp.]
MSTRDEHGGAVSKLLGFVVVLAVLLVVVDRVAVFAAERVAADRLQSSQGLAATPDVAIAGFPFLNQFAAGRYEHVSATAKDVRLGSSTDALTLSRVRLDFRTVTTSKDFSRFHARSATAHATVDYAELSRRLGVKVRYAGAGRVKASKTFTVLGQKINPTISVKPTVANDVLSFTGSSTNGLQGAPRAVTDSLQGIFGTDVSLKGIPFDVKVTSLRVDRRGLELALSGKNLSYSPGG